MKASRTTSIRTHEDFVRFQNETNGLHDAYLLSAEYHSSLLSNGKEFTYCFEGGSLVLRYMVTSLRDHPTVEIVFRDVAHWRVKDDGAIFGCDMVFDHPYVTFFDLSDPETRTEVRAREMAWRWIDEKEESTMTEHENTHNHLNENVPTDYL